MIGAAAARRRARQAGQSTLEFALVAGVALTLVFSVIGYSTFSHAQQVTEAAARAGATAGAAHGAGPATAARQTNLYLDGVARGLVIGRRVRVSATADQVTVVVDGTAVTPVLRLGVHARAVRTRERFRPDGGG